ncbi:MAG: GNAT family N-acetyltransferase [Thermoanaerobaculia bacterium]
MIRNVTSADLPRLIALLAEANDTPYDLVRVAEEKCFGAGVQGVTDVRVFGDFSGVSVRCGDALRILAVAPAQRRPGVGAALLQDAQTRGATLIGAEAGNYFTPGVLDTDETTVRFLLAHGFSESESTLNLEVEPLPAEPSHGVKRATLDDRERVLHFIEHDFGAIWRFEADHAFQSDQPKIFYAEEQGEVVGFAAHDANNRGLGWFGPTGVRETLRGRGIGSRLLQASLGDLRRMGHTRVVIPWTDAVEFYQRACNAQVTHRFLVLRAKARATRPRRTRPTR